MEKTIFKTQKFDFTFKILYFVVLLIIVGIAIVSYFEEKDPSVLFVMLPIIAFILILILSTIFKMKIIIGEEKLKIENVFTLYQTNIRDITKIRKGETMWSGFHKYGTRTKGLIIFAKKKNDLYITPENEDLFYQKILEINPEIIIEKV